MDMHQFHFYETGREAGGGEARSGSVFTCLLGSQTVQSMHASYTLSVYLYACGRSMSFISVKQANKQETEDVLR